MIEEIVVIKFCLAQFLAHFLGLLLIDFRRSLLNQAHDIAHAQNPGGHPVRIELFQIRQFFTHTYIQNRLARYGANGKSRASAGISVQLCQDDSIDSNFIVKGLGHVNRILTGHGVYNQYGLIYVYLLLNFHQLIHHCFVNMKPAGRIQNHQILSVLCRVLHCGLGDIRRLVLVSHGEHRDSHLLAVDLQLFDGCGPVNVTCNQKGLTALFRLQLSGQLRRGRGFSGALKAGHHQNRNLVSRL